MISLPTFERMMLENVSSEAVLPYCEFIGRMSDEAIFDLYRRHFNRRVLAHLHHGLTKKLIDRDVLVLGLAKAVAKKLMPLPAN